MFAVELQGLIRRLLLFLLTPLAAYCQEGEDNFLVNLGNTPSGIVNSSVNVISGDYAEVAHDLVLPGIDNLTFSRKFSPFTISDKTETLPGWASNHRGMVIGRGVEKACKKIDESVEAEYLGPYGIVMIMGGDANRSTKERSVFTIPSAEMTNVGSCVVSGKTDYRNLTMVCDIKAKILSLRDGGGEKRLFQYMKEMSVDRMIYPESYLLECVEHPNKHRTFYTYNEKRQLSKIVAKNGGYTSLSTIEIDYINSHTVEVKANNEQKVKYLLSKRNPHLIESVDSSNAPSIAYEYYRDKGNSNDCKVRKKSLPNKRFLEMAYYDKRRNVVGDRVVKIKHRSDYSMGKVAYQRAPVGATDKPIVTQKYFYRQLPNFQGETWVYDAFDHLTSYDHDHRRLRKNEETFLYHGKNEVGRVGASDAIVERRILGKGIEAEVALEW